MNLEQAKAKVADISRSTATKHPKVLVSELCGVVQFLLNEIERIQSPPVTILPKRLPEDLELDADRPEPFELPPISPPPTTQPEFPPRRREGNIDWSNIKEAASISPEEAERLDSPSGEVCGCGKEMTNGEAESFGVCCGCYDG